MRRILTNGIKTYYFLPDLLVFQPWPCPIYERFYCIRFFFIAQQWSTLTLSLYLDHILILCQGLSQGWSQYFRQLESYVVACCGACINFWFIFRNPIILWSLHWPATQKLYPPSSSAQMGNGWLVHVSWKEH